MARPTEPAARLHILVVRSGGFAGIRREWQVEPEGDEDEWLALLTACPWNQRSRTTAARDAFVWKIEARMPHATRSARLPDDEVVGPWRELVDRVQQRGEHG